MSRKAIILGAGPAGLTAAHELLKRTEIVPVVLEKDAQVGGLSKTVMFKGNRMDIGGHRFFSKSDRVMQWWLEMLPLEKLEHREMSSAYHEYVRALTQDAAGVDPKTEDQVMLVGTRHSRIFFAGKFFDYPISLTPKTLLNLGVWRSFKIGSSYLWRVLFPKRPVWNLEDFMINRFGDELYRTFFEAYTEKVWGVPCRQISAAWGAQRIKDVSVGRAILHWIRRGRGATSDLAQKDVSTSMIERFLYPKFGPGQMWEETARRVQERGGEVLLQRRVTGVHLEGNRVVSVEAVHVPTGQTETYPGDLFFSSMPIQDLIRGMGPDVPGSVQEAAVVLPYREFIAVGLLVKKLKPNQMPDSWLYIQEPGVKLGRMQIYNNWSRYMIHDPGKVWLGLEYFCNYGDSLWRMSDEAMIALAGQELAQIGLVDAADVIEGSVQRMEKAYPAYFKGYGRFPALRNFLDQIENLYLIGRNGMHKYNNQDHSMLTAMTAVDNLVEGIVSRENIWAVNTEEEYLEEMVVQDEGG